MSNKHLLILGIRGVPAAHGGFESFAERLGPWMVRAGWRVTIYCQGSQTGRRYEDDWEGCRRVHIPVRGDGTMATIEFDFKSTREAVRENGVLLTLGYNTGFLSTYVRTRGRINLINMDGLEWKRAKYHFAAKAYLWVNERLAAKSGTRLIADHPSIADHLATRVDRTKIEMIPYGSPSIEEASPSPLALLGLEPSKFLTIIARPEPENSILEIVTAFAKRPRGVKLAVLGRYSQDHSYQKQVLAASNDEVIFTGAIYDQRTVQSLRFHSLAYVHGHQVGGTNPSLVEALGAGNPVIGHDNRFNRWVAGEAGLYFSNVDQCDSHIIRVLTEPTTRDAMAAAARRRWTEAFSWPTILEAYRKAIETTAGESVTGNS